MAENETQSEQKKDDVAWPMGTVFLMLIFLILLAGLWGAVYIILLNR
jgi:hypothetical protein